MARDYEIREWLGGEWAEETTRALIEQIQQCGTDDEEVWIAICQRHDGESIDALTAARHKALLDAEAATGDLRGRVRLEWIENPGSGRRWTKSALAEAAGVTRATLDDWLRGTG